MNEVVIGSGYQETVKKSKLDELKERYKEAGKVIYQVVSVINEDDDSEKELIFLFKKPTVASYDRYVKTTAASSMRALKTFIIDNIVDEQEEELRDTLEEYPALAIGVGEKLLNMLGLSKSTAVKKL